MFLLFVYYHLATDFNFFIVKMKSKFEEEYFATKIQYYKIVRRITNSIALSGAVFTVIGLRRFVMFWGFVILFGSQNYHQNIY